MKYTKSIGIGIAGAAAGIIAGLFGAGGGLVLIPLLSKLGKLEDNEIFPSAVAIILPICLVTIGMTALQQPLPWKEALPYLGGSILGGIAAGLWGHKIPVKWLHRILGILILWGGIRNLC